MTCSQREVLQTVVDEYSNLSPQTTNVFFFRKDGETIAANQTTTEDQTKQAIANFSDFAAKTNLLGSLESLTINGVSEQLIISKIDDLHLATISSKKANPKVLSSLNHVLIPTIVRLINQQNFDECKEVPPTLQTLPEEDPVKEAVLSQEEPKTESDPEPERPMELLLPKQLMMERIRGILLDQQSAGTHQEIQEETTQEFQNLSEEDNLVEEQVSSQDESDEASVSEPESSMELEFQKPPVNQLMIEKIKGIRVPGDTVRVDSEVIENWITWREPFIKQQSRYGDKELLVNVQTLDGTAITCKFKPIKGSKSNAKGIIQMPEKILQALQASKGQLVTVSPEIE